jgi:hypothetical protein
MNPGLIEQSEKKSTKQMGIYHDAGWRTSKNWRVFIYLK